MVLIGKKKILLLLLFVWSLFVCGLTLFLVMLLVLLLVVVCGCCCCLWFVPNVSSAETRSAMDVFRVSFCRLFLSSDGSAGVVDMI